MGFKDEAFVYILVNKDNDRYYVGYHKGTTEDGYVCSSQNYEFWEDYESSMNFERYYVYFGTKEECKDRESELLSTAFCDAKSYNFSNGKGGFSLRGRFVGLEIKTRRLKEADSILREYNDGFIWYKKDKYIELGFRGISQDIRDSKTNLGRIKLAFRQTVRKFI